MNYTRTSHYMPGCDGTKLAVDLYRPDTQEKVPLLVKAGNSPRRRMFEDDKEAVERFLEAGYAVAFVEVRGIGASYGIYDGFFGPRDGRDMKGIINTLAQEEWCTGKVGTYGGSNHGMVQEITLLEQPEHLYASAPCDCSMDFYDQDFPNGVSALPFIPGTVTEPPRDSSNPMAVLEQPPVPLGDPVDEDPAPDYPMAHEAQKCHERNLPFLGQHLPNMYRDDVHPYLGYRPNLDIPSWERMDDVRFGRIPVWSIGAWFDPGCTNKILTWKSWGGKLLLGPWPHCGIYHRDSDFPNGAYDWEGEHLRFYDALLKGKDSGSLSEPPVTYYTMGDTPGKEWHRSADFPVEGTTFPKLYLSAKNTLEESPVPAGSLDYTVREDIQLYEKMGRMNRHITRDMTPEDEKSLTFTSAPLPKDLEITGAPVLDLWVTSTHTDGNFIAALEMVTPQGESHFLTEGMIRGSHAKIHPNAIYASLGLPYHRGYREDRVELSPTEPTKLSFHLEATSWVIPAGCSLRISISCGGSGFQQPQGFPQQMPTITLYTGEGRESALTLPVIKPTATVFESGEERLYVYRRCVYRERQGRFTEYPCRQAYPMGDGVMVYETDAFTVEVTTRGLEATAVVRGGEFSFTGTATLPDRYAFGDQSGEIPLPETPWANCPPADVRNLYVATVPVGKGVKGEPNIQMRSTFDLFVDLIYPQGKRENLPCIVNIHGFGGNHHQFETNTQMFLDRGYAVASIDYRLCPPSRWPSSGEDARACIRYLKAHSQELGLDPQRFGLIGGSMGGHLTAMLAACNGDPQEEGKIGGCLDQDCRVKAAAAYYAFTDFFHFGEDSAQVWPAQPRKVNQSDGPFAPLASLLGYLGEGRGMADVKAHLWDQDPQYRQLREAAWQASPISHVTEHSAPLCLVHGIFECGIQVPMGQSVRMFEAYSRKGVKSLLLCNNNGLFGEDPEVKQAVVEFLTSRV
ncbi:MAG: CocE/NonD family hydrolase [Acutalibacter sp.]|jgi:putative CocE/NonD family hydrolase